MYACSYAHDAKAPIAVTPAIINIVTLAKEDSMGENKGKGTKGRNYDDLSGVGTSQSGVTGTTGNLNTAGRDGGVGTPDSRDVGNLQSAENSRPFGTPALGRGGRGGGPDFQSQEGGGSASGKQADDKGTKKRRGPGDAGGQGSGQAG